MRRRVQQERVDVGRPVTARPPVQAGGRAARVPGGERAEDGPAGDGRAAHDGRHDGFVGRPQPVGVLHGQHPATGQQAREHDDTRGGGQHRSARGPGEVDPAVARSEAVRRLPERLDHGRDGWPERPRVRPRGCGDAGLVDRRAGLVDRTARIAPRRAPTGSGHGRRGHAHQPGEHRRRDRQGCRRPSP